MEASQPKWGWYRAIVRDTRGVLCTKEGDVFVRSYTEAHRQIERLVDRTTRGVLEQITFYDMDAESGKIGTVPLYVWNRTKEERQQNAGYDYTSYELHFPWAEDPRMGWDPYDGQNYRQSSQPVSIPEMPDMGDVFQEDPDSYPVMTIRVKQT